MDKLLSSIRNVLSDNYESEFVSMHNHKYFFDKEFVILSSPSKSFQPICFIDGGNGEILNSSSFSLNYNKICQVSFEDKRLIDRNIVSFFSLARKINDRIVFDFEPENSFEEINEDVSCYDACCLVRSCKELLFGGLEESSKIIVIDGSFEHDAVLKIYFDSLKKECLNRDIVLLGLSKTSSIVTSKGRPVSFVLKSLEKNKKVVERPWLYPVGFVQDGFETSFVKLHPKSEYILRVDYLPEQKDLLKGALESLLSNCSDPVFLGYPYGLVLADDLARVSKQDVSELKAEAFVKLGKDSELVEDAEKSEDAHSVLDKARF